jgi:hypothetical protein
MTEDDPDVLTNDRNIARSRSRALTKCGVTRGDLDAFHAANIEQRQGSANVIWQAAAGEPPQNWK